MPPPSRALPEEVVEEILLRLPPHKPACLARASLASKPWLALLSSSRFRARYREFHGVPPMLGFLQFRPWNCLKPKEGDPIPPYVSTTKFRPRIPDIGWGNYAVWDCRHGRVLLGERNTGPMKLAIWDPMTGRSKELQEPSCMAVERQDGSIGAAVVCASSGCDHRACHEGPSQVVFFSLHNDRGRFVAQACVSFQETSECSKPRSGFPRDEWSEPCSGLPIEAVGFIEPKPPVLVKDAIHFTLVYGYEYVGDELFHEEIPQLHILKYDFSSNCLSLVDAPSMASRHYLNSVLMALEDGSLGFVIMKRLHIYIWSRQIGSDGATTWTQIMRFRNVPTKDPPNYLAPKGSVEGSDIIFVYMKFGIYKINLKTLLCKKIWEGERCNALIPYMSFYNPRGIYPYLLSIVIRKKFLVVIHGQILG
jgi:hypothetical protein